MKEGGNNSYIYRYPDCTTQPAFTGKLLEKPRKIILMMIFSFEMDTLEVALKEQQDFVDKIFLVETSATHKGVSELGFHALPKAQRSCMMVYNNTIL